jgi:hypothetical protein
MKNKHCCLFLVLFFLFGGRILQTLVMSVHGFITSLGAFAAVSLQLLPTAYRTSPHLLLNPCVKECVHEVIAQWR